MAQDIAHEVILDSDLQSQKNLAWWLYLFHGASLLFSLGMLSFIPLIINYLRRPESAGSFVYSHHSWQIRSFWWYVLWLCVGGILFATFLGIPVAMLVWGAAWIWKAYRILRGFMDLNANKPMPG